MEKIRQIAKAHYNAGSRITKELAHQFFDAMDEDGDGQVDAYEFFNFMAHQEGHERLVDRGFFRMLDRDENGALDFWDVMTLYYIMKSGRPFCKSCDGFVVDVYFACVECHQSSLHRSYCLCLGCYSSGDWDHDHHGRRPRFLDNYSLLEAKRISDIDEAMHSHLMRRSRTSNYAHYFPDQSPDYSPDHSPPNSPPTAIVPARRSSTTDDDSFMSWRVALETFERVLNIANLGMSLRACSIM